MKLALAALALFATPALGSDVWIVDDSSPGGHFAEIQDAIDHAASGDVVLVRPGGYRAFEVVGKGLTILGEDPAITRVDMSLGKNTSIRDVPEGEACIVRGLDFRQSLKRFEIVGNPGLVWVEDCRFERQPSNHPEVFATQIEDSTVVWVDNVVARGLRVRTSDVYVYGSTFTGRPGGFVPPGLSTVGGPALFLEDSTGFLSDCKAVGGLGATDFFPSLPCTASPGGPGLLVIGESSQATSIGCEFVGGPHGLGTGCPIEEGEPVIVSGGSHVVLPGTARALGTTASALPGGPTRLLSVGELGDAVLPFAGFASDPIFAEALSGAPHLAPPIALPVPTAAGTDGSSVLDVSHGAGLGAAARVVVTQAVHVDDAGMPFLSGPSATVLLDPDAAPGPGWDCNGNGRDDGWDLALGDAVDRDLDGVPDACQDHLVLWVDDDAAGDPVPGSPAGSDPLEDGSALHPFDTIQEAIDAAPEDAYVIVRVRPGTYSGMGNQRIDFGGKALSLESESGNEVTSIDADGSAPAIRFESNEPRSSRVAGFGFPAPSWTSIEIDDSSPTILDCTFRDGSGPRALGILVGGTSRPYVGRCEFTDISATSAGAALFVGLGFGFSSLASRSPLEFVDCSFEGLTSQSGGGAVFVADSVYDAIFTRCRFVECSAPVGGAIRGEAELFFDSCLFAENTAETRGGAIFQWEDDLKVRRSTFSRNRTLQTYLPGPTIGGASIETRFESTVVLLESILWDNKNVGSDLSSGLYIDAGGEVAFSLVQGGQQAVEGSKTQTSFSNNVFSDPRFVDPTNGDFRLQPTSPMIDRGRLLPLPAALELDLDATPRLTGHQVDLGAYEHDG